MTVQTAFARVATSVSHAIGSPYAFAAAAAAVVAWAVSGPFFGYSEFWQLTINTGTTIVTFLVVFLIQNSQNRGENALHLKLDELIRVNQRAHNALIGIERREEEPP